MTTEICDVCVCPATIETAWGDWYCQFCYDHSGTIQCPFCPPSQVVTFVGLPVADVDEQPDEAPTASLPLSGAVGATTLDLPQVQGGNLSASEESGCKPMEQRPPGGSVLVNTPSATPFDSGTSENGRTTAVPQSTTVVRNLSPVPGVLPPESGTGGTLADQLQALTWCVTRAYDSKEAPAGLIDLADAGLLTFERHVRAVGGAR